MAVAAAAGSSLRQQRRRRRRGGLPPPPPPAPPETAATGAAMWAASGSACCHAVAQAAADSMQQRQAMSTTLVSVATPCDGSAYSCHHLCVMHRRRSPKVRRVAERCDCWQSNLLAASDGLRFGCCTAVRRLGRPILTVCCSALQGTRQKPPSVFCCFSVSLC